MFDDIEETIGDTWTCHVCGKERPDEKISVYTRTFHKKSGVSYTENVRYCNDNPECEAGAANKRWIS